MGMGFKGGKTKWEKRVGKWYSNGPLFSFRYILHSALTLSNPHRCLRLCFSRGHIFTVGGDFLDGRNKRFPPPPTKHCLFSHLHNPPSLHHPHLSFLMGAADIFLAIGEIFCGGGNGMGFS